MIAFGYARQRSPDAECTARGLELQRQRIVAECRRRGWTLAKVMTDDGTDPNLPGKWEVLRRLAAGEADALVIVDLDRLTRRPREWIEIVTASADGGWRIVITGVPDEATAWQLRILCAVASY